VVTDFVLKGLVAGLSSPSRGFSLRGSAVVTDFVVKGLVAGLSSPSRSFSLRGCSVMTGFLKHSVTLLYLPSKESAAVLGSPSRGSAVPTYCVAKDCTASLSPPQESAPPTDFAQDWVTSLCSSTLLCSPLQG